MVAFGLAQGRFKGHVVAVRFVGLRLVLSGLRLVHGSCNGS